MDYDAQRMALAERLRQAQAMQQAQVPQGQMVGRIYVPPAATQYLSTGLRQFAGAREAQNVQNEQKALGEKQQTAIAEALRNFGQKAQGAPAQPTGQTFQTSANEMGDEAATVPQWAAAQKPDLAGAYQSLLTAPDKGLQQFGMQGVMSTAQAQAQAAAKAAEQQRMLTILQSAQNPQQAIAAGVPPELVKNFYESRNFGRDKVTYQDVGGQKVPVTEYGDQPAGVAPLQKTGNPFSDLVVSDPKTGAIIPNAPLVQVKGDIAAKGAAKTNLSVNMPDKKFYEGLGKAVSGQIEKGFDQAQSAVQTLNNANQIAANLDKALIGPLANQRMSITQIGQVLGVGGKDAAEVLANTRNVMQGLARQELSAAGQMKGQGQITESERAILRKAEAGEIKDFTRPEIETFISAIRKTSRSRIANHQRNLQNLGGDEQASTILPYLQIEVPEDVPIGGAAAPKPQGIQIRRLP